MENAVFGTLKQAVRAVTLKITVVTKSTAIMNILEHSHFSRTVYL